MLVVNLRVLRRGGNGPAPQRQEPQTFGGGGTSGSNGTGAGGGGGGGGGGGDGRNGSGDGASDSGRDGLAALLAALGLADPEGRKKAATTLGLLAAAVAAFLGAMRLPQ